MKTTAYLLEWSPRGLGAVDMKPSYSPCRVEKTLYLYETELPDKHEAYFHPPNYQIV